MTIPDFQTIMLPLLEFCADEKEHTNREAIDYLAEKFKLPDAERKELLPSGRQAVFDNRIAWARAHLKIAKLIENTQRGVSRITNRGKKVLKESPQRIDINYLTQFSEYAERREDHRQKYKKSHEKEKMG